MRLLAVAVLMLFCVVLVCAGGGCADPVAEARVLEREGDLEGAVLKYKVALEEDSNDLEALSGAALCLYMLRCYDEALGYQERVVALDPADTQTRIELGFNYLNHQEKPSEAVRVFEEAADQERTAKNLTFLAQARNAARDLEGAEAVLREAIAMDPEYRHAYSVLACVLKQQGRSAEAEQVAREASLYRVAPEESAWNSDAD